MWSEVSNPDNALNYFYEPIKLFSVKKLLSVFCIATSVDLNVT